MSEDWLKPVIEQVKKRKTRSVVVETGITPSGPFHLGHLREVVVGDAVCKALKGAGLKSRLIYVSDDLDRLRRRYPFLPEIFEKYVGQPLASIPSPDSRFNGSYAEFYLAPFLDVFKKLGIEISVYRASEQYRKGFFKEAIAKALAQTDTIRQILEEVSGHKLSSDWSPYRPWCKGCHRIDQEVKILNQDLKNHKITYRCTCGFEGTADFATDDGKLQWRVDWPARWWAFKVSAEPFGKEHATTGGSYDTGCLIAQKVFDYPAPVGVPYEFLYLKGAKGKMSSSLGNVLEASEILKLLPPDLVKDLLLKNANRHLEFDTALGIPQLYESSGFPFTHLTAIIQAAQNDLTEIKRLLKQSGHQKLASDSESLGEQVARANYWLENFAPQEFKFELQKEVSPAIEKLDTRQKKLLGEIADALATGKKGEILHNFIYQTGKALGLTPQATFEPIYLALLGKKSGPKAGWFLSTLERRIVVERFRVCRQMRF